MSQANRRMSIAPSLMGRQSTAPGLNARQSVAPRLTGRQSMAPGFLGRMSIAPRAMKEVSDKDNHFVSLSLEETVESAVVGTRDNVDVCDQLWCLLAGDLP